MTRPQRDDRQTEREIPTPPAPIRVEFLPDEKCLASITKQIRATHMAYPLFGLARMFLQEARAPLGPAHTGTRRRSARRDALPTR